MTSNSIPEYSLKKQQVTDLPFQLEAIEKNNGYNPRAPHRHNYYEIFLFEEGGGLHMIDFHEMEIEARGVHFVSPGQIHFMHRHPKANGWVLKFSTDFFLTNIDDKTLLQKIPFLNNKVNQPIINANEEEFSFLLDLLRQIKAEFEEKRPTYEDMIRNYLNLILLRCQRLFTAAGPPVTNEKQALVSRFKSLLDQHFSEHKKVGFYSEKLGVSEEKLSVLLKSITGHTPGELMADRILLETKRWLLHTNSSIKEIAYALNFQDDAYFNRWFKKRAQLSPGEFRTTYRKKYNG